MNNKPTDKALLEFKSRDTWLARCAMWDDMKEKLRKAKQGDEFFPTNAVNIIWEDDPKIPSFIIVDKLPEDPDPTKIYILEDGRMFIWNSETQSWEQLGEIPQMDEFPSETSANGLMNKTITAYFKKYDKYAKVYYTGKDLSSTVGDTTIVKESEITGATHEDLADAIGHIILYDRYGTIGYLAKGYYGNSYQVTTMSADTVDDYLSTTSTNPVQNKVITEKLNEIIAGAQFQGYCYHTTETLPTTIGGEISILPSEIDYPKCDLDTVLLNQTYVYDSYGTISVVSQKSAYSMSCSTITSMAEVYELTAQDVQDIWDEING